MQVLDRKPEQKTIIQAFVPGRGVRNNPSKRRSTEGSYLMKKKGKIGNNKTWLHRLWMANATGPTNLDDDADN